MHTRLPGVPCRSRPLHTLLRTPITEQRGGWGTCVTQGKAAACSYLTKGRVPRGQVDDDSQLGHHAHLPPVQVLLQSTKRGEGKDPAEEKLEGQLRRTPVSSPLREESPQAGHLATVKRSQAAARPPRFSQTVGWMPGEHKRRNRPTEAPVTLWSPGSGGCHSLQVRDTWHLCGHQTNPKQGSLCSGTRGCLLQN